MDIHELEINIEIILKQLRVNCKKFGLLSDRAFLFAVEDFGLVVCCINRLDYTYVSNKVAEEFSNWRFLYITTDNKLDDTRYKIIWALMRGGYMKWLRLNLPNQTREILLGGQGIAKRIVEERLRIWNNKEKYKFFIEDNKAALSNNLIFELAKDPGFFDFMPEED